MRFGVYAILRHTCFCIISIEDESAYSPSVVIHFYQLSRGRLYEAWIAYPADKSYKYNNAIHALNNGT